MSETSAIVAIDRLLVFTLALVFAFAQRVEVLAIAESNHRSRFVPRGLNPSARDILLFLLVLVLLLLFGETTNIHLLGRNRRNTSLPHAPFLDVVAQLEVRRCQDRSRRSSVADAIDDELGDGRRIHTRVEHVSPN